MIELVNHPDGTKRASNGGGVAIFGMAMDAYHRTEAMPEDQHYSKTRLHAIVQTDRGPEWVYETWLKHTKTVAAFADEGDRDVGDSKEGHFKVGRAIDDRLFDPASYPVKYVTAPEFYPSPLSATECKKRMLIPGSDEAVELKPWHSNAGYCKEWMQAQEDRGVTVLTTSQAVWVERAHNSLMRHPEVKAIMEDPNWVSQVSFRWTCPITGRKLQARPDLVNFATGEWADLKTTRYWLSEAYGREYFNRAYHLQSWLIDMALRMFMGNDVRRRRHIIVGKQQYPQTKVLPLAPLHIDAGRDLFMRCHEEYLRCEKTGEWWEIQKDHDEPLFIPAFIQAMHSRREDMARTEFYDYGAITGMPD